MMKERWLEVESEASAKPERQFERWLSAEGVTFSGPEAEEAYRERVTLLKEAIELEKAPQRIPVCPSPGFFPMEYAGISVYDAMYDYDKLAQSWVKYCDDFGPDSLPVPLPLSLEGSSTFWISNSTNGPDMVSQRIGSTNERK